MKLYRRRRTPATCFPSFRRRSAGSALETRDRGFAPVSKRSCESLINQPRDAASVLLMVLTRAGIARDCKASCAKPGVQIFPEIPSRPMETIISWQPLKISVLRLECAVISASAGIEMSASSLRIEERRGRGSKRKEAFHATKPQRSQRKTTAHRPKEAKIPFPGSRRMCSSAERTKVSSMPLDKLDTCDLTTTRNGREERAISGAARLVRSPR